VVQKIKVLIHHSAFTFTHVHVSHPNVYAAM